MKLFSTHEAEKAHLSTLPLIPQKLIPLMPKSSKRGVILIPVFFGGRRSDNFEQIASAACWAWRSWIVNSDVAEFGIEVRLYIEVCIKDVVMPVIESNNIPPEAITYFDGSHIEGTFSAPDGTPRTWGTKKMASYSDERFKDYDYIFDADGDLFIMSLYGGKLPFFQRFFEKVQPGVLCTYGNTEREYEPPFTSAKDRNWARNASNKTTPESIKAYEKRLEELAGKEVLEIMMSDQKWMATFHNGLTAYPAKEFMNNRPGDVEFLTKAARLMVHDEAVFTLWHSMGNPIFNLYEVAHMARIYLGEIQTMIKFYEKCETGKPFMFHNCNDNIGVIWKQGIGAI